MGSIRIAGLAACLAVSLCAFDTGKLSNRRAPGFSLPDVTMKQHDPADYRGKIIILDFMQTHCPTCKMITGVLEQVSAKYGDKIQVLSVVIMPDSIDNVRAYMKEHNVKSPILFDSGQMAASYLKITPANPRMLFPHIFILDKGGWIRNDFDAMSANNKGVTVQSLSAEIDKILQEKPTSK